MSNKVVYGIYDAEEVLLTALKEIRSKDIVIKEVYSPFPIHGLDHALGLQRTRLAIAAFFYGALGCIFAFAMTYYIMIIDWPMNIGGKPNFSLRENMLSFVPIFFEFTVLCAAHGMAITYLIRNKTLPGMPPRNPDPRTTDDKFVMEIKTSENSHVSEKDLSKWIKDTGFMEIEEKKLL